MYNRTQRAWELIRQGENPKALEVCLSALSEYGREACAKDYVPYIWNYAGEAFFRLGDLSLSRSCYLIGIDQAQKVGNRSLATTLNINTAATYHEAHDFGTCLALSDSIYSNPRENLSAGQQILLLNNMAVSQLRMQNLPESKRYFDKLFATIRLNKNTDPTDTLLACRNFAEYLMLTGNPGRSAKLLVETLNGFLSAKGPDHFQTANTCLVLGRTLENLHLPDSALNYYERALSILRPATDALDSLQTRPSNYETLYLEALLRKGELLRSISQSGSMMPKQANLLKSLDLFQTAIRRIDLLMRNFLLSESGFIISDKVRKIFSGGILLALKIFELTGDRQFFTKAFLWSIESKNLSFLASSNLLTNQFADPATIGRAAKYYSLRSRLDLARRSRGSQPSGSANDSVDQLAMKLLEVRDSLSHDRFLTQDYQALGGLSDFFVPGNFTKRTFINYFECDSVIICFGINSRETFYRKIPVDNGLADSIAAYQQILAQPRKGYYTTADFRRFTEISHYLYGKLVVPVAGKFISDRLLICPDGNLAGLPFEPFITEMPRDLSVNNNFRDAAYLGKNFIISYLSNPVPQKQKNGMLSRRDSILIVPDGSPGISSEITKETEAIARKFRHPWIFSGSGDLAGFLEHGHYPVLHFAGHVQVDREDPYHSKIHNRLTWGEILSGKISANLVYINGCESAGGPANRGEGILSPGYAFAMAGSPVVLEHLWIAPNESSAMLAASFYDGISGRDAARTLQKTKLLFIAGAPDEFTDPHYWASLICYERLTDEPTAPAGCRALWLAGLVVGILAGGGLTLWRKRGKFHRINQNSQTSM